MAAASLRLHYTRVLDTETGPGPNCQTLVFVAPLDEHYGNKIHQKQKSACVRLRRRSVAPCGPWSEAWGAMEDTLRNLCSLFLPIGCVISVTLNQPRLGLLLLNSG